MAETIVIRPPENINQSASERLSEMIRAAGIAWKRKNDPDWRDKPWKDGVVVDLDERDVIDFIAGYIIEHSDLEKDHDNV